MSIDETKELGDGRWLMWALPQRGGFTDPGHRRFAQAHSSTVKAVQVVVSEDPDGPYYGWIAADKTEPVMIYGHRSLFRMCFHYGPEAEQEAGRGRIVRLSISAVDEPDIAATSV